MQFIYLNRLTINILQNTFMNLFISNDFIGFVKSPKPIFFRFNKLSSNNSVKVGLIKF